MNNSRDKLREGLLSLEQVNPDFHNRYKEEIDKMFNEEIKGAKKFGMWSGNLFRLFLGLGFLYNTFFNQPFTLPMAGRILWGVAGLALLGMAAVGLRIVLQKKMDMRKDSRIDALVKSSGLYVVGFAIMFMAFGIRDIQTLNLLTPIALLTIVIGILISIHDRVHQGEMNTREKLLEIEYRLAALDERLQKSGTKS